MSIGPLNLQNSQASTSLSTREIRSKVWEEKKGEDMSLSTGTSAAASITTFDFVQENVAYFCDDDLLHQALIESCKKKKL